MITNNEICKSGSIEDWVPFIEPIKNNVVWKKEKVPVRVRTELLIEKNSVSVTAFHEDGEEVFLLEFPIIGSEEEQIHSYRNKMVEIIEWWINTEMIE